MNSHDTSQRTPDSSLLIKGYHVSQEIKKHVEDWNYYYLNNNKEGGDITKTLTSSYSDFPKIIKKINSSKTESSLGFNTYSPIYTAHEALILDYESSFLHQEKEDGLTYCLSAEFLWIGKRTNSIKDAHVEFFRGIENPLGMKIFDKDAEEVVSILRIVNPKNEKGKIILITRFGAGKQIEYFDNLVQKIKSENIEVLFMSDPMHGNTETHQGIKTRKLENIVKEIDDTSQILQKHGYYLHGLHFESSPFEITECIVHDVQEIKKECYTSLCDPRLNLSQITDVLLNIENL